MIRWLKRLIAKWQLGKVILDECAKINAQDRAEGDRMRTYLEGAWRK